MRSHTQNTSATHAPFSLVLTGGGARGLAHIGVLRALEHAGLFPSAVVGVSMGAIIGAVYALNPNWYDHLTEVDLSVFSQPSRWQERSVTERISVLLSVRQLLRGMVLSWGAGTRHAPRMRSLLHELTLGRALEESPLPLAVTATDLGNGERVVLTSGDAGVALYASAAIPGVFPPLKRRGRLLADGAFVDNAPVDVARDLLPGPVVAVNVCPPLEAGELGSGAAVLKRALSINLNYLMWQQLRRADLVIQPGVPFGTLEFEHRREGVAAGVSAVREGKSELHALLSPNQKNENAGAKRLPRPRASAFPPTYSQPDEPRLSA